MPNSCEVSFVRREGQEGRNAALPNERHGVPTFVTWPDDVPHDAGAPTTPPTFGPTVIVVNDGFSVKARGGNIAPGCSDTGVGLAVGKVNGDYDYDQLKVCVAKVKKLSPDLASETHLMIAADPGIPIQAIISVIDAVRKGPGGEVLFPDPLFGLVSW